MKGVHLCNNLASTVNPMPTSNFAIYTIMLALMSMVNGYLIALCIDALREEREDGLSD